MKAMIFADFLFSLLFSLDWIVVVVAISMGFFEVLISGLVLKSAR